MERIIWISDIHMNNSLNTKSKKLIKTFVEDISKKGKFDGLVISGDVAMSGASKGGYETFKRNIIDPILAINSNIKTAIVPGNHDVDWDSASDFILRLDLKAPSKNPLAEKWVKEIDAKYFDKVFQYYNNFHFDNTQFISDTFSGYLEIGNTIFVLLNSAWLSIGNPASKVKLEVENFLVSKTPVNLVTRTSDKSRFNELGSQTYGFNNEKIAQDLEITRNLLRTKFKDHKKVLVAHHPPNNWMDWNELYTNDANTKSEFHNFILEHEFDAFLVGHEHTSGIEAGLLYGTTLVFKSGMFMDHHQNDVSNSWYQILEINDDSIKVENFNYNSGGKGKWTSGAVNSYNLNSLKNLHSELSDTNSVSIPDIQIPEENCLDSQPTYKFSEPEILNLIEPSPSDLSLKYLIKKLTESEINVASEIEENVSLYKIINNGNDNYPDLYYVIGGISDVFDEKIVKNIDSSYIGSVIRHLDDNYTGNIFVYYLCGFVNEVDNGAIERVKFLIENKFNQFRANLFRHKPCVIKFKNAKFALHFENDVKK